MIEKGQPVPPELFLDPRRRSKPRSDLRSGIVLLAVGVGLVTFFLASHYSFWSVGVIPLLIGIARIVVWILAHARSGCDHEPLDDNSNPGSVDSTARGSDFQHDLELAMLKLSEHERAVVTLCLGSSLTRVEAAGVLQLPVGTVKTHLLREREKLRALLAEWKS